MGLSLSLTVLLLRVIFVASLATASILAYKAATSLKPAPAKK